MAMTTVNYISFLQLIHPFKYVWANPPLFCRSMSTCHRRTLHVFRNFFTSLCIYISFCTSLSGYALLNASRTAAKDFVAKWCSRMRMSTLSAPQYTTSHLHSFCATDFSGGAATRVTLTEVPPGKVGTVYYTGVDVRASDFIFVPQYVIIVGSHFISFSSFLFITLKPLRCGPWSII
jgi:hypothetical protein